jgi:hypothetical protein
MHCSVSRSQGRRPSAPPLRHAVSIWSLSRRVSSSGLFPVVPEILMISASRWLGIARRALGNLLGFATRIAGLLLSVVGGGADVAIIGVSGAHGDGSLHRITLLHTT